MPGFLRRCAESYALDRDLRRGRKGAGAWARWQLTAPHRLAGEAVRALAWLGPEEVEAGLEAIRPKLSAEDMRELAASRAVMPAWMAEPVSAIVADGISQTT